MSRITRNNFLKTIGTISGAMAGSHAGLLAEEVFLSKVSYSPWIRIPGEFIFRMVGVGVGGIIGNKTGKTADRLSK